MNEDPNVTYLLPFTNYYTKAAPTALVHSTVCRRSIHPHSLLALKITLPLRLAHIQITIARV